MLASHPTRLFLVLLLKTCCGPSDQGGTGGDFLAGSVEPLVEVGANRVGEQAHTAILTVTVAAEMADVDEQFVAAPNRVRGIDEYDTRMPCSQGAGDGVGFAHRLYEPFCRIFHIVNLGRQQDGYIVCPGDGRRLDMFLRNGSSPW